MLFLDSHNAISPNTIAFQVTQLLQNTTRAGSVIEVMKLLRWEHVFDPWHLLDLLGQIKSSCCVIIDDVFALTAPYQDIPITKQSSASSWTLDAVLSQLAITLRYLNAEINCIVLVLDSNVPQSRPPPSSGQRKIRYAGFAYEEAIHLVVHCSGMKTGSDLLVLEVAAEDPSFPSSRVTLRV